MGELITKRGVERHLDHHLRFDHRGRPHDHPRVGRRRPDDEALLPDRLPRRDRGGRLGGQRKIPIQYAERVVGRRITSGGSTYRCA